MCVLGAHGRGRGYVDIYVRMTHNQNTYITYLMPKLMCKYFTIQRHKLHALVFVENGNKVMVKSSIYVDFAVKSVYFAIKIRNSHTF